MPSLGGRFSGLARSVLDPAFTPGWAATPLLLEGRSRSFSNSGFSQRRPGAWLKPVFEKPAKAGSDTRLPAFPGPKGPVYYASRQTAKAVSSGAVVHQSGRLDHFVKLLIDQEALACRLALAKGALQGTWLIGI